MKKIYFTQLIAALLLLCCTTASAYSFKNGGIYYDILSSDKAVVTYSGEYDYTGAVVIPSKVTYYGIEYTVTGIKKSAFYNCFNLTSITIPATVTNIEIESLSNTIALTTIIVEEGNPVYDSRNNCNAVIETATNTLIAGCKNTIIPEGIKAIGTSAFRDCDNLTSIELPATIESIGDYAFHYCTKMENITLPQGLKTIGTAAFGQSGIKSITLPQSLTSLGNSAFSYSDITKVTFDNCAVSVGDYAFISCIHLTSVDLGSSITSIGSYAFNSNRLTSVVIPNSVTSIGSYAFYSNELTSVVIPNSVTSIGEFAFSGNNLTSVVIPNSVTSIGSYAFSSNNLTSVVIPNSVTSIENYTFSGNHLTSITIPQSVTSIGDGAFSYNNFWSIELPAGVTYIGSKAFERCSLTEITIPGKVTEIGTSAFKDCTALKKITLPEGLTKIGLGAFEGCTKLKTIISHIPASTLFTCYTIGSSDLTIYVPKGSTSTYKNKWPNFAAYKEIVSSLYELNVSAARYATLYLDYNAVVPAGLRVYYAEKIEGESLLMERINDVIPANTGVIVTGAAGTYTFDQAFEEVAAIENNLFRGTVKESYITPEKNTLYYVLSIVDGVVGMYYDELTGGTFKNNAHKAYLPIFTGESLGIFDTTVNAPDVQLSNRYTFNFGGITAVESITTTASDEAIYNLNGQRVENPTKGIYIVNGKKVIF